MSDHPDSLSVCGRGARPTVGRAGVGALQGLGEGRA